MDRLKHWLTILAYFFNPRKQRRREKEQMYNRLKGLEEEYEKAMEASDPVACEKIHAEMDEARERIEYLESKDD